MPDLPKGNTPVRSIRVSDALWASVKVAADREDVSVSEWVVETLRRRVRRVESS